jgi:hypothetical protein
VIALLSIIMLLKIKKLKEPYIILMAALAGLILKSLT